MAFLPSSSSFTYAFTYDVFLNFRGIDTRYGFTGNLYKTLREKGIHTFIDIENLQREDEITPSLVKAIQDSRIAIPIFSKNYASSSFALDELVTIIDCVKAKGRLVLPIFYDVDPSDVRLQIESYGEALAKHEKRFANNNEKLKDNMERLQKWKKALNQAANLPGYRFKLGNEYEHEFIGRIVTTVFNMINITPLHVVDHPVGLESRMLQVKTLLEVGSDDGVHMVGIYGIGGIGKTTIARAVYNLIADQFEGLCFLDRVRENSMRHGLVHLQKRLLFDVLGEKDIGLGSVKAGISIIKHRLRQKKVLLILDDVNQLEQLEALVGMSNWFGSGSRIIITTRDRHLLAFHGVERKYEVEALNDTDALNLFSWNAFRDDRIDPNYMDISKQVLAYASGLPLALEVIGAYLFGKGIEEWKSALRQYERIPNREIQDILKISFDALQEVEKSVFLDIACCFNGYELTEIEDILRAHYGNDMKHHIQDLVEKSLISISLDDKVMLHPLVEHMGKEIVRQESPQEPGRRSRLWFSEDIIQVLQKNTGTSKIEIIHMAFPLSEEEEIEWDGGAFKKMANLKALIIRNGCFSKGPKHLPSSLRVLEWWRYPSKNLPSDFHPEKVAILKIVKLQNTFSMSSRLAKLLKISLFLQTLKRLLEAEMTWRLVGLVSSVVGLSCYALSPSFNRLIGGWNIFKVSLYGLLFLTICATILFVRQSSLSRLHVQLRAYMGFAVLMIISVYSFFYDRAVNGKPEILSLVSNAAFALMSLSLSRLNKFGFEMGTFSFFLGCLTIQLVTIDWKLISVAIIFGCPLFIIYYSEFGIGSQPIHSSPDSRPEVDNGVQHAIDIAM